MKYSLFFFIALAVFSCKPYEKIEPYSYDLKAPAILDDGRLNVAESDYWVVVADTFKGKPLTTKQKAAEFQTEVKVSPRPYLWLVSGNDSIAVSNRHIPFDNILNMRDLGGIQTADGKSIKWGLIYRSGHLGKMSKKEFEELEAMGISHVFDFRTRGEIDEHPDKIPSDGDISWFHNPITGVRWSDIEKTRKDIRKEDAESFDGNGKMVMLMDTIVRLGAKDFAKVFEAMLADTTSALLYHCTAGKDRTGLMTALFLGTLGVDNQTIMDDYLLSNYFRQERIDKFTKIGARLVGIENEAMRSVMEVREAYLETSLNYIMENYGSVEKYMIAEGGLTPGQISALKDRYLE